MPPAPLQIPDTPYHMPRLLRGIRGSQPNVCARPELSPSCSFRKRSPEEQFQGAWGPLHRCKAPAWVPSQPERLNGICLRAHGPSLPVHRHSAPVLAGPEMLRIWTWAWPGASATARAVGAAHLVPKKSPCVPSWIPRFTPAGECGSPHSPRVPPALPLQTQPQNRVPPLSHPCLCCAPQGGRTFSGRLKRLPPSSSAP